MDKPSKIQEPMLQGDFCDRRTGWIALPQCRMDRTQSPVPKKRHRTHADGVVKASVQRAPRDVAFCSDSNRSQFRSEQKSKAVTSMPL
jgi:hypothetical protein